MSDFSEFAVGQTVESRYGSNQGLVKGVRYQVVELVRRRTHLGIYVTDVLVRQSGTGHLTFRIVNPYLALTVVA